MRKTITLLVLVVVLLVGGFWFSQNGGNQSPLQFMPSFESVQFTTPDGVTIVGNYYRVDSPFHAVLLLHMMPATKESWHGLAGALQEKGIASLAIDLRGHGESVNAKGSDGRAITIDYQKFTDEEHQAKRLDVESALSWIQRETNLQLNAISIAGASIGANLALEALAKYPEISKGVLLSPGLNYRGIEAKSVVTRLSLEQKVFYVTSKDDGNNIGMTEELFNATVAKKEWKVYDTAGHGTAMLERADDLLPSVVEFLVR